MAVGLFPIGAINIYAQNISATLGVMAILSMLLFLAMSILIAQSISKPVHLLSLTMQQVSQGNLSQLCPEPRNRHSRDEITMLIEQFNQMIEQINGLLKNKVEQERNLRYAEIQNLRAQINPHFIYNTLNSIRSVARLKGDTEIADITTSLAKIIREGTSTGQDFCSLQRSLELAHSYFAIESWRWPGRFTYMESIPEALYSAKIPRLIIQPLVENALSHGLEEKPGPGVLTINAVLESGNIIISIIDTGNGVPQERLAAVRQRLEEITASAGMSDSRPLADDPEAGISQGHGIALINTHRRLVLIYGVRYGLKIDSVPTGGCSVSVTVPFDPLEEE